MSDGCNSRLVVSVSSLPSGDFHVESSRPYNDSEVVDDIEGVRKSIARYAGRAFQSGYELVVRVNLGANKSLRNFAGSLPLLRRSREYQFLIV